MGLGVYVRVPRPDWAVVDDGRYMTHPSHKERIRKLLTEHPDGLTAKSIGQRLGVRAGVIRRCIDTSMPDCYIDRWDAPVRGQYQAVYCRAYVPSNCPHPSERFPTTTTWRTRSVAAVAMMNGD